MRYFDFFVLIKISEEEEEEKTMNESTLTIVKCLE